jgi:lipoprotein signal peptidase
MPALVNLISWDRCYDFGNIFARKLEQKIDPKIFYLLKIVHIMVLKSQFARLKLGKIVIITLIPAGAIENMLDSR